MVYTVAIAGTTAVSDNQGVTTIDLNCDLGEGAGHDAELLELVTTANVSCGFHAGDPDTAFTTLHQARQREVRVGAHPSFADREHFGRRELDVPAPQLFAECVYQIGALRALATVLGMRLTHVKPHGGLYNRACRDAATARVLADAAGAFNLPIMGLPNSQLVSASWTGFIAEGFADRRYQPDGSLVPRSEANAFVEDADEALEQAVRLIESHGVQSLCVHGDNPQALEFVRRLRDGLAQHGFRIAPFA